MNRRDRRKLLADARKSCPTLDLRPGKIGAALPGMIHWGPNGENLGVWGQDKPCRYVQFSEDGDARPLTDKEMALAVRIYGPLPTV